MRYPAIATLALAMLMAIGGAFVASAQDTQYDSGVNTTPQTISGTIVASDGQTLTIATTTGDQMKFTVNANNTNMPTDLRSGSRVDVTYLSRSDGQLQATNVALTTADATGTGTASTTSGGATTTTTTTTTTSGSMDNESQEARHLPSAASPMPLIAVTGLIALAAAFGLRVVSQRD